MHVYLYLISVLDFKVPLVQVRVQILEASTYRGKYSKIENAYGLTTALLHNILN